MTKVSILLSLGIFLSCGAWAQQRSSCWPKENAVSQRIILSNKKTQSIPIVDQGYRPEESRTILYMIPKEGGHELKVKFRNEDWDFGSPQNFYAMMILSTDGNPIYFEDFTGGCNSSGLSVFPKQELDLFFLKQSALTEKPIHILLWSQ